MKSRKISITIKMDKLTPSKLNKVKAGVEFEVCLQCKWYPTKNPKACSSCA